MASLESIPPDQRAVLQLVLQRGRTYDQIAQLLSIDRAGVHERARSALDALGPQGRVPDERRALITDYLLGQLPEESSRETRDRLAQSASERAWARVVAAELAPLARDPLPEIPLDSGEREPVGVPLGEPEEREELHPAAASGAAEAAGAREPGDTGEPPEESEPSVRGPEEPERAEGRPSSRRGGAILLGLGALAAVVALVVVLVASGGSSSSHSTSSTAASASSSSSSPSSTSTTGNRTQLIAQVNLVPPTAGKKTAGLAQIVRQSANTGLVIVAQGVPANTAHDAYAVWLYNSPGDTHILGFVNPGVKANGRLQTAGVLPSNASHYRQVLVTLETQAKPKAPGKIVLQGALRLT
jgi:hypothetical protein